MITLTNEDFKLGTSVRDISRDRLNGLTEYETGSTGNGRALVDSADGESTGRRGEGQN